jgi:predicted NACHT family NTPase
MSPITPCRRSSPPSTRQCASSLRLAPGTLRRVLRHRPADLRQYRLARVAEWSRPRYALDRRFVRLGLPMDRGEDHPGPRWERRREFHSLEQALTELDDPVLVLPGAHGAGKSTLLRRLDWDLALAALRGGEPGPSLLLSLNLYKADSAEQPPPDPLDWLAGRWQGRYPHLPPLRELLDQGPATLLLDGLNEIPHRDDQDYRRHIDRWRDALAELTLDSPAARFVFSCRSLDYSAPRPPPP